MFNVREGAATLASSAKRAAELAMLLLENRLELLSLELRQEKRELVRCIVRALIAVQLSLAALVLACISVVWFTPPEYRGLALLAGTLLFALLAFVALAALKTSAARMGKPLQRTIEEFKRDREAL